MDRKEMLERLEKGEDALELSIKKWEDVVQGKGRGLGASNCALCQIYLVERTTDFCKGCPVCEKTSYTNCVKTPYTEYELAYEQKRPDEELIEIAKRELEFLKSLRK